jgi:hypothetical protein
MAIATLAECFNNPRVFTSVVKIRKSLAVALMMEAVDMDHLYAVFDRYVAIIGSKVTLRSPLLSLLTSGVPRESVCERERGGGSGCLLIPCRLTAQVVDSDPSAAKTRATLAHVRELLASARAASLYTVPSTPQPTNTLLRLALVGAAGAAAWYSCAS